MSDFLEISDEKYSSSIKLNFYWLRDHCRCDKCYDVGTAQRKFNFMDIPLTIRPKSYEVGEKLCVVCKSLKFKIRFLIFYFTLYNTRVA